jgi:hypothetical protein
MSGKLVDVNSLDQFSLTLASHARVKTTVHPHMCHRYTPDMGCGAAGSGVLLGFLECPLQAYGCSTPGACKAVPR